MYLHIINLICFFDFCVRYLLNETAIIRNKGFALGIAYLPNESRRNLLHLGAFFCLLFTALRFQSIFLSALIIASLYNLLNRLISGCVIDYIYFLSLSFNLCDLIIVTNTLLFIIT
ncbi:MAG: hypothetical protein Harvfovirus43_11 [Harvfovirus sp.]|uniref:Signal peptidase II n=1 Tax=Harvfovirus sp. TaxID=2487768 RepID=A0A3G5A887_9VIRU|nr:MAG: hypothetical protein Harvfovirus43_11 [Harvfovirus sp.]